MRIRSLVVLFVMVLFFGLEVCGLCKSSAKHYPEDTFVPGEIIVKFKKSVDPDCMYRSRRSVSTEWRDAFRHVHRVMKIRGLKNVYRFRFTSPVDIHEMCKKLAKEREVEFAEPNYIGHFCNTIPNDPSFTLQWYLRNTGQSGGSPGTDLDALMAWDINTGDESIVVAVIDTGVDYNHPDLADNIWHNTGEVSDDGIDNDGNGYVDDVIGWDFVSVPDYWAADDEDAGPEDNDPMDRAGHGTYCAGAIAAVGNNGIGISGVTWKCKIMPVRIGFRTSDGGSNFFSPDAARGIRYAADNGARVINLSWIIRSAPAVVSDAIKYAYSKGVVVIGAVGNDDAKGAVFPASMTEVIGVAATDGDDNRALWVVPQPPMPGEGSNYGIGIDVAAPGVEILTTALNSGYLEVTGTSISAAIASGLAGLVLSVHPGFDVEEVRSILKSSAESELNSEKYVGYGRINAYRALLINDVPGAEITFPDNNTMLSGIVEIKGSANGHSNDLGHYTVEYAKGIYPQEWTLVADSSDPVEQDILATWDTDTVADGKYTLKLTVYDDEGNYKVVKKVVYVNKDIHEGWPVKVEDQILAHPVAGDINGDGLKEVVVASRNGNLYVFKSTGELFFEKFLDGNIFTSPVLADINADGNPEIIVATDSEFSPPPSKVYVFDNQGNALGGWPKEIDAGNCLAISVGDIDGDGNSEIVASTLRNYGAQKSIVYVWNADGSSYGDGGWPKEIELNFPPNVGTAQDYSNQPVLADLDADGKLEIIVSIPVYEKGTVYVWKHDGSNFHGWPLDSGDGYTVHISVGDIDADGDLELVGVKKNGRLLIWNSDGSSYMTPEWPKDLPGALSDPVLADLDRNGDLEIVVQSNSGHVYVYNHDGSFLSGWPIAVDTPIGSREWAPMSVGDVDGDGIPEIIAAGGTNNAIYIFRANGSLHDGWPRTLPGSSYTEPVFGDMDDDGKVEIVTTYMNSCVLWDLPGNYVKSTTDWPVFQFDVSHRGKYCFFCKADIDNDGDVDGADLALFGENADPYLWTERIAEAFGHVSLPIYP